STSEWCHCQRDPWMLLPALLALRLRLRQREALLQPEPGRLGLCLRPLAEGALGGAAFWIKPHVAVPALACWLAGARGVGRWRWLLADGLLVIAGGALVGAAGIAWLVATGAWADFWDV